MKRCGDMERRDRACGLFVIVLPISGQQDVLRSSIFPSSVSQAMEMAGMTGMTGMARLPKESLDEIL